MTSHADPATGGDASYGPPPAPRRVSGKLSGLSYEAEPCPECQLSDQMRGGAIGGVIGWAASLVLGASPFGRLLGAGLGIAAGAVAAKWHLRVDWDPEALKASPARPAGAGPEAM